MLQKRGIMEMEQEITEELEGLPEFVGVIYKTLALTQNVYNNTKEVLESAKTAIANCEQIPLDLEESLRANTTLKEEITQKIEEIKPFLEPLLQNIQSLEEKLQSAQRANAILQSTQEQFDQIEQALQENLQQASSFYVEKLEELKQEGNKNLPQEILQRLDNIQIYQALSISAKAADDRIKTALKFYKRS